MFQLSPIKETMNVRTTWKKKGKKNTCSRAYAMRACATRIAERIAGSRDEKRNVFSVNGNETDVLLPL